MGCMCITTRISCLMSAAAVFCGSWRLTFGCQVSWVMSVEQALVARISCLMSAATICCGLAVDVCTIGGV